MFHRFRTTDKTSKANFHLLTTSHFPLTTCLQNTPIELGHVTPHPFTVVLRSNSHLPHPLWWPFPILPWRYACYTYVASYRVIPPHVTLCHLMPCHVTLTSSTAETVETPRAFTRTAAAKWGHTEVHTSRPRSCQAERGGAPAAIPCAPNTIDDSFDDLLDVSSIRFFDVDERRIDERWKVIQANETSKAPISPGSRVWNGKNVRSSLRTMPVSEQAYWRWLPFYCAPLWYADVRTLGSSMNVLLRL